METYPYFISVGNAASSPSSSYSNSSNCNSFSSREERNRKPAAAALHGVRKLPAKHVITKKPIAPMPPTPPKIYKVEPINFRDVVQSLTAAPEFQRARLREVAPPPLAKPPAFDDGDAAGFNLSSPSWCSSLLLSPGTIASFGKNALF